MWFTTLVATGALGMIHPALPIVLAYDYFLLLAATKVLNRTCTWVALDSTKRHLNLNKLNFLGFGRAPSMARIPLNEVIYLGDFVNKSITMRNMGLLPSMQKFFVRDEEASKADFKKEDDSEEPKVDAEADGAVSGAAGDFRYFHSFIASNEIFYIAKDHPD